ncbi:MAG: PilZ domain-containing protein [Candidatus Eisenbacteria bacterium]|uniref:PilZ domain-containing protein n=1 Tax=Eiseniibacteriota bacterium TaxID=2212470 RepID=A0A948RX40_UNCEI|nr:PilZ domain-containing protein [Candidatus Eisenbacteria bacterium]MBU1950618.1 PilZ domain-containing protein [Candidatus Eisenbacteria bacterium]MBU2692645.1 PilZ domain-containing protein [Candidatus Eisenbacteria bacterium]
MSPRDKLKRVLEGRFEILDLFSDSSPGNISDRFSSVIGIDRESISDDEVKELFEHFISEGSILRALTLLKILSLNDREGNDLAPLLASLLEREALSDIRPATVDLLATKLLGTNRPSVAWNNLMKTSLIFQAASAGEVDKPQSDWLVCHDETPIQPDAPHGMLLYLRIVNSLPDSSSPVWNRKNTRTKVPMPVYFSLVGHPDSNLKFQKYEAALVDLSPMGMGLQLVDLYGCLKPAELKDRRIRLEIVLPSRKDNVHTFATIMWCKEEEVRGRKMIRFGAKFQEAIPEQVAVIQQLIKQRKRDQQLLWSLWDTKTTNL